MRKSIGIYLRVCMELLEITNQWRASRGEGPLVFDLETEDGYES